MAAPAGVGSLRIIGSPNTNSVGCGRPAGRHPLRADRPTSRKEAEMGGAAPQRGPVLTEDMKRVVGEQRLGFVATVCPDGTPSLSPKGTTAVWDDEHLVFADIRSPGTVENLRANNVVEVNVVDPIVRKGYRFKGEATVLTEGALFEQILASCENGAAPVQDARSRIRSLVLVKVERVGPGAE